MQTALCRNCMVFVTDVDTRCPWCGDSLQWASFTTREIEKWRNQRRIGAVVWVSLLVVVWLLVT